MSKRIISVLAFIAILMIVSCKSDMGKQPAEQQAEDNSVVFVFTSEDSLAINELADKYVSFFNSGDFNSAADMLYTVHNDSVSPLTDQQRKSFINAMSHLPHLGFQKKEITLKSDLDNRVRIAMLMNESGSLEEERATINCFINPVKIRGIWYLTAFDKYAEGVGEFDN